ncbi:MAG: ABC transporter permease [Oscillospiraceae bacterium]|nr:ABC transporter permease [Oscillospiraceae bacterium]
MAEWLASLMPNVMAYTDKFWSSCAATGQMFLIAGGMVLVLGAFFGVLLTVTRKGGIAENPVLYRLVDTVTNVFRSIPFVILLIFLIPLTRKITGTAIGVKGAIVPLVFGATPFFTRQVEAALANVSPGKIEAAEAMGSGKLGIIFRVYLHEAVPDMIRAVTITAISLIGLTTMAGAVGAGGIGSFAINYGQNLHHQDIVNVCVIVLLIFVSLLQGIGNGLARRTTNRALFQHRIHLEEKTDKQ